jgi:ankyrin repeat protein
VTTEISELDLKLNVLDYSLNFRDKDLEFPLNKKQVSGQSNLDILKDSLPDFITNVWVYSNPLFQIFPVVPVRSGLFHAYVVFTTNKIPSSPSSEMWWSLEKNGKYIILQQSPNKTDIIDTTFDVNQRKIGPRLLPVEELEMAEGNHRSLENLLESLLFSSQLGIHYHLLWANCQRFASYVFEKANGERKKWTSGTSGSVPNEKETLFGVSADTIRYKSFLQNELIPFYHAIVENEEMVVFKSILANYTSESINKKDSQGYTLLEWAEAFSREHVKTYLKTEKGAVQSESFHRNVFFIALQYLDSQDELNDPKLSFDGIDITSVNGTGDTALHCAIYGEKWKVTKKILEEMEKLAMPVVDAINHMGETALHLITKLTCPIETFKNILGKIPREKVDKADKNGCNAFHWATIICSPKKMKLLLKKGADIDAKTVDGHAAIHLALQGELNMTNKHQVVEQLLKYKAGNTKDTIDCTPLHRAVMWNDISPKLFQKILDRYRDNVTAQDNEGDTPLMVALYNQSETKAKELLKYSQVNVKNKAGWTALHYAAMWPDMPVDLLKEILDKSDDANAQDDKRDTPLHWALQNQSKGSAYQLLQLENVDVNIKNNDKEMAIHLAANWWEMIPAKLFRLIMDKTNDINDVTYNGNTALIMALMKRSELKVKELLEHKKNVNGTFVEVINVNVKGSDDFTALHWAARWPNIPIVLFKTILTKSTDKIAKAKHGITPLHCALAKKSENAVQELLKQEAVDVVNVGNDNHRTGLHLASRWLDIPNDLFQSILNKSTNINAQDKDGNTALHLAVRFKSTSTAKKLLEIVDVNIRNIGMGSILHFAAVWPEIPLDLFREILNKTDNINNQVKDGSTALQWALMNKSETAVRELLNQNVDVNIKNNYQLIALHFAVAWPEIPIDLFQMILQKTEDINAKDKNGKTALDLASYYKSQDLIQLLEEFGKLSLTRQNRGE